VYAVAAFTCVVHFSPLGIVYQRHGAHVVQARAAHTISGLQAFVCFSLVFITFG